MLACPAPDIKKAADLRGKAMGSSAVRGGADRAWDAITRWALSSA